MQPTDPRVWSVFVFPRTRRPRRRIERGTRNGQQGLVEDLQMKAKISRVMVALASVAMIALAGGASLRGF